jgi:hypothetical protein
MMPESWAINDLRRGTLMWIDKKPNFVGMSLQYLSDASGNRTAVVIPIDEWDGMRNKYPEIDTLDGGLAQWQKDLIDKELQEIAEHPECLRPIEELFAEM